MLFEYAFHERGEAPRKIGSHQDCAREEPKRNQLRFRSQSRQSAALGAFSPRSSRPITSARIVIRREKSPKPPASAHEQKSEKTSIVLDRRIALMRERWLADSVLAKSAFDAERQKCEKDSRKQEESPRGWCASVCWAGEQAAVDKPFSGVCEQGGAETIYDCLASEGARSLRVKSSHVAGDPQGETFDVVHGEESSAGSTTFPRNAVQQCTSYELW